MPGFIWFLSADDYNYSLRALKLFAERTRTVRNIWAWSNEKCSLSSVSQSSVASRDPPRGSPAA